jgi:hypothetical protein
MKSLLLGFILLLNTTPKFECVLSLLMGINIETDNKIASDYIVTFTTDVKEWNDDKPVVITTTTRSKDITIPVNAGVRAFVSLKQPANKISLDKFEVWNNTSGVEDDWADGLTSKIILDMATAELWKNEKLIPELESYIEQAFKSLERNDNRISLKSNIGKAFAFMIYNYTVNNIPRGLQQDYLQKKLNMSDKYFSQLVSRYSVTYKEIQFTNQQDELFMGKEKFAFKNKTVYFVRHTEKLKGGYLPNWLKLEVEDFINKEFVKVPNYRYQLDPDYTGAVG